MGIVYESTNSNNSKVHPFAIDFYADSDFATDPDTRKSRSGGPIMACGGATDWWSRRQNIVTLSTCEAELVSLLEMGKDMVSNLPFYQKLKIMSDDFTPTIFQDNQSTIKVADSGVVSRRTKHFDLKYHWITDQIEKEVFKLEYCDTLSMLADIMTKNLPKGPFERARTKIGVKPPPRTIHM